MKVAEPYDFDSWAVIMGVEVDDIFSVSQYIPFEEVNQNYVKIGE